MSMHLRAMTRDDWPQVAELIHVSTNFWYQSRGRPAIFTAPPQHTTLFCEVYEDLDPGCCVLAISGETGRVAGSCFYHPRPTHVSLGIMNVHPNYSGQRVARTLLDFIVAFADRAGLPLRLVSSAVNLDSFSLYNRAGFVPRMLFQDMLLTVPSDGLIAPAPRGSDRVRPATLADAPRMAALERELTGIEREKDYRYFLENRRNIWHASILEGVGGRLEGFLVSVAHPASTMLGPGVMRDQSHAAALILAELNHRRGCTPVWLVPCHCDKLVQQLYAWGARNCELHMAQCRGPWTEPKGVVMPTFMPETA